MNKKKTYVSVAAVVLVFLALLYLTDRLLRPKYMTDLEEGSMTAQYYRESGGHDVIFIGDCEVYANFTPMELYRQQGITAYVRGNSQQLLWQSYYILKETYRYETPKTVVLNVNAMRYDEPVSEAFNRLCIDQMRWSPEKVGIIRASMTEEEDFLSYVFPILRYHARFDELTAEDFLWLFGQKDNTWNGYQLHTEVNPVENLPAKRVLPDYQFGEICYEYLDKIRALCQEHGSELILIKAPSVYPYWYDEYEAQITAYAEKYGLAYYNFLNAAEEIGLDYSQDTYDGGLHLNLSGATKLTEYFGQILARDHGLPDHRTDPEIAGIYDEKLRQYDAAITESE